MAAALIHAVQSAGPDDSTGVPSAQKIGTESGLAELAREQQGLRSVDGLTAAAREEHDRVVLGRLMARAQIASGRSDADVARALGKNRKHIERQRNGEKAIPVHQVRRWPGRMGAHFMDALHALVDDAALYTDLPLATRLGLVTAELGPLFELAQQAEATGTTDAAAILRHVDKAERQLDWIKLEVHRRANRTAKETT